MEPRALERGATSAGASWPWSGNTRLGPSTMVIGDVITTLRVNTIPMSFLPGSYNHKPQVLPVNQLGFVFLFVCFFVKVIVISDFFLFVCGMGERD